LKWHLNFFTFQCISSTHNSRNLKQTIKFSVFWKIIVDTTLNITSLSILTFSTVMLYWVSYLIGVIYTDCHKQAIYAEYHYVEGHYDNSFMLSVAMPNCSLQQAELFECYFNCYIICASFVSNLPLAHRQKLRKKIVKSSIFQLCKYNYFSVHGTKPLWHL